MIPKQDRQSVRKATDIEQKYDLNTDFSEIKKVADSAKMTADSAQKIASGAMGVATSAKSTADGAVESIASLIETVEQNTKDIYAYVDSAILGAIEGSY